MKNAYVTAICNGDRYVPGVEALGRSLVAHGTKVPRVVMVTPDVPEAARRSLEAEGWTMREVDPLENPSRELLFPRFGYTFMKLRAWELVEHDKIVFMDADTIALKNLDELFDRPYFAAAPDFFIPDRFNSGVMVLDPSRDTFARMMDKLANEPSYDGGDQGFLNNFYPDWWAMPVAHRLPAGYNLHHFIYQFLRGHPVLKHTLEQEARVVHYTVQKPWLATATLTGGSEVWWNAYYGAHPEEDAPWKHKVHELEDLTFDRAVEKVVK
jgi:glycogenin glucosyltransferase